MIGISNRCPPNFASHAIVYRSSCLVGKRDYRQPAIEFPDSCLREVFQGCIFGDEFCVEFEFCLY